MMRRIKVPLAVALWLLLQMGAWAFDPTDVNGAVAVEVDRSQPVWSVTVTNHSKDKLNYEMTFEILCFHFAGNRRR